MSNKEKFLLAKILIAVFLLILIFSALKKYYENSSSRAYYPEQFFSSFRNYDECLNARNSPDIAVCNALFGVTKKECSVNCRCIGGDLLAPFFKNAGDTAFNFCPEKNLRNASDRALLECEKLCRAANISGYKKAEIYNFSCSRTGIAC